jgi:hypothetical protein
LPGAPGKANHVKATLRQQGDRPIDQISRHIDRLACGLGKQILGDRLRQQSARPSPTARAPAACPMSAASLAGPMTDRTSDLRQDFARDDAARCDPSAGLATSLAVAGGHPRPLSRSNHVDHVRLAHPTLNPRPSGRRRRHPGPRTSAPARP